MIVCVIIVTGKKEDGKKKKKKVTREIASVGIGFGPKTRNPTDSHHGKKH